MAQGEAVRGSLGAVPEAFVTGLLWWCRTDVLSVIIRTSDNNIDNY